VSNPARRTILIVAVVAMAVFCASRLHIGTDVTNFMPDGGRAKLASLSRKLANSELTRTMTLSVGAPTLDQAVDAADELARELAGHPEVAWIRTSMSGESLEEAVDLYFPRRYYFATSDPEKELSDLLSDAGLQQRARRMLAELRQPIAPFLKPLTMRDPLGLFRRMLDTARASQPDLPTHRDHLVSADGQFALVLLATVHSHFESATQAAFLDDLGAAIDRVAARHPGIEVEASGANRIAVHAEQSIKRDIYRIGACTFLGVAIVFLLFFRSLGAFLLTSMPAMFGIACATTSGILLFGGLDGLTIAFGTALMGVAIDYSIHVLNHHTLDGTGATADETVARLRPSLTLGATTTMASFAGLVLTTSPAFRELGFFAIVGMAASLLATIYFLPAFLPRPRAIPSLSRQVARLLGEGVHRLDRHRNALRLLVAAALVAGVAAVPHLNWVDDLSRLGSADPEIMAEEARVRSRLPTFETGRFVIAIGDDAERALQKNDRVHARLSALQRDGAVGGVRSLHQLLPSRDLQQRNLGALRQTPDLAGRVDRAFHAAGFRSDAFATAFEDLDSPPPPLTLDDLRQSSLAPLLTTLALPIGDQLAVITYLRDVRSDEAVEAALADLEGVVFFEQRKFINEVYAEFRATSLRQILVGTVLVAAVLMLRYRRARPALAALLPSLLVVAVLLASFAALSVEMNLLHVIALMMIMGMGVDYGVFLVDSVDDAEGFSATMLSLLISCLTTVLVFGTLAISEHPALRAIGVTTGGGVLLAFLFAPVSLLATRRSTP